MSTQVDIKTELETLHQSAKAELNTANNVQAVDELRVKYLGRKGQINDIKRNLKDVSNEDRPIIGALANEVSNALQEQIEAKLDSLKEVEINTRIQSETLDVTMPGVFHRQGVLHPLTRMTEELSEMFRSMGFDVIDDNFCPEVETDYYNFDALNFPPNHPARDMQDTFYTDVDSHVLLRSQTSNSQIRYMEKNPLPVRVISPGRVYRNEDVSRQKNVLFHQLEGLLVDEDVTVSDLKGILQEFIKRLFGEERPTRFRTSYFPFTEPSMEMDVLYKRTINGQTKEDWLEIMGCGMVDPNVLENCGIDAEKYTGFAFGMGIERLAMLKYNIHNIRDFYQNDLRFLNAFKG